MNLQLPKIFLSFIFFLFLSFNPLFAQRRTVAFANDAVASTQKYLEKADEFVDKIDAAFAKVEAEKERFKQMIDGAEKQASLPRAILPPSGDKNYALVLNEITIKPTGTVIEVYMKIPGGKDRYGKPQHLYFIAEVPFSSKTGLAGDARLFLLKNTDININKDCLLQFNGLSSGKFDSTYVTFNCKGFKDITLNGKLVFNGDFIKKEADTLTKKVDTAPMELKFYIQADKFANFVIKFRDIPKFQFKKIPDFSCKIDTLVLDMSDVRNAPLFVFPQKYVLSDNYKTNPNQWRGLYVSKMKMEIPPVFKEDESTGKKNKPITVLVKDLLIDEAGLLMDLKAAKVLKYGNVKGFSLSIDSLKIYKNSTADEFEASMKGKVLIPMSKDSAKSRIDYSAMIQESNSELDLTVSAIISKSGPNGRPRQVISMNALGAKTDLSRVGLTFYYIKQDLDIAVSLDGEISLKTNKDPKKPSDGIAFTFKNLNLSSKQPYVSIGNGGSAGIDFGSASSTLARFPVQVTKAALMTQDNGHKIGLDLGLALNLMKSGSSSSQGANGFKADAAFKVWAKRNANSGKWEFDNVDLGKIHLAVNNSAYKLEGTIMKFDDDKTGTKGFCGNIQMVVIGKLEVGASAIFGKSRKNFNNAVVVENTSDTIAVEQAPQDDSNNEYRFWYVDAKVVFSPSIMFFPGLGVNAFNGALYHNMSMVLENDKGPKPESPTAECKTTSGKTFVPDNTLFLGFQAGIGISSSPSPEAFAGNLTFGMEFKNTGAVKLITLDGFVSFMNGAPKTPDADAIAGDAAQSKKDKNDSKNSAEGILPTNAGKLAVEWETSYDVDNSIFKGDFRIFVNADGVIQGGYNNKGYAGKLELYFAPNKWYVYIGRPVGAEINLEIVKLFKMKSYLCLGYLPSPAIAPLPSKILEMVGNSFNPDPGVVEGSTGISFGARVSFDKELSADIGGFGLFAKLEAELGFDVVLSKTPTPVFCSSGNERGVNNWYAVGQAFLSASGEVGLDVFGSKIPVLEGGVYAVIFAQLPRPTYVIGKVRVEVSVNLLLKTIDIGGDLNFEFGEQCAAGTANNKKIKIITGWSPANGAQDQPVFTTLKIFFDKPIDKSEFLIKNEDDKSGSSYNKFKFETSSMMLKNGSNTILFKTKLENGGRTLNIIPETVLPEGVDISFYMIAKLRKQVGVNWVDADASVGGDTVNTVFRTLKEPRIIELANVFYAYPMVNMENFYPAESNLGYVRTKVVPNIPLKLQPGFTMVMKIMDGSKLVGSSPVVINKISGENNLTYTIPSDKLELNKNYKFMIVKTLKNAQSADNSAEGNTVVLGYEKPDQDTTILEYNFKTSKFKSFTEKFSQFSQLIETIDFANLGITQTYKAVANNDKDIEGFSNVESEGVREGGIFMTEKMVRPLNPSANDIFDLNLNGLVVDENTIDFSCSNIVSFRYFGLTQAKIQARKNSYSAVLPIGSYNFKLGYFLPGQTIATSTVNLFFNIKTKISIN